MAVLMKCGHSSNATRDGKPCCVICAGIIPGAYEIAEIQPDLTGRKAKCASCGKTKDSSINLPFFEYRPNCEFDDFYDGCRGWD